jgi:hypothetical protein
MVNRGVGVSTRHIERWPRRAELEGLIRVHLCRIETSRQSMTLRTLKIIAGTLDVKRKNLIGNQ